MNLIINQQGEAVAPEGVQAALSAFLQFAQQSLREHQDGSLGEGIDPRVVLLGFVRDLDLLLRQQPFSVDEHLVICCPPLLDSQAKPGVVYVSTLARMFDRIMQHVRGYVPSESDEPGIMTEHFLKELIMDAFVRNDSDPMVKLRQHLQFHL